MPAIDRSPSPSSITASVVRVAIVQQALTSTTTAYPWAAGAAPFASVEAARTIFGG